VCVRFENLARIFWCNARSMVGIDSLAGQSVRRKDQKYNVRASFGYHGKVLHAIRQRVGACASTRSNGAAILHKFYVVQPVPVITLSISCH